MGTAIGELIEKEAIDLSFLSGRKVGVDSYNILYQFLSSIRGQDGTPLMDSNGKVTSHLTGLLYRTVNLLEKGIKPVFVFDGKPSVLKAETLRKRTEIRTDAARKHKDALERGDMDDAKKFGSRALKLTEEMVSEAKELAAFLGLPVVQAPSEGEAQIACMAERGDLYGCISQDYDALLFGTPLLLRNIAITGRRKVAGKNFYIEVSPEKIELEKVLSHLKITREKLIWLGILIGTDFNEKFPRIGPKTGLKLVQEHETFEDILAETKHEPEFDYREIEELFLKPKFTEDYKIEFRPPETEKVIDMLCGKHDFSEERVKNALAKLEDKANEKGEQSRLDKWV
ncbi:MAG: flap endonuclease-1 [Candidatus Diapherotrites archaeon]|nr:flap endonuclease-1 [Candidatus Micrarchaeota archaeon]